MYKIGSIILIIIFYCIYYGKLISQKRTGIQTNQLKKQSKGKQCNIATLMFLSTVMVPVAEIVAISLDVSNLSMYFRSFGLVVALLGDIIFLVAVITMGNSWRAGVSSTEKTELITVGIYSISRNPAFLAFDLLYMGILLTYFNWWHLFVVIFAIVMLHLQVVFVEEPFLPTVFGEDYIKYRNKVCRYLGRK